MYIYILYFCVYLIVFEFETPAITAFVNVSPFLLSIETVRMM